MSTTLGMLVIATLVGAGLVTGLLFAFSNFVMRALADLPHEAGMSAMQRINERILNPLFFVLFFGTPLGCVVIAMAAVQGAGGPGAPWLLAGALTYLAGPLAITMLCNVPLNNRLARTAPAAAGEAWPEYRRRWQRWNHLRTCVGIASIALLATGLAGM